MTVSTVSPGIINSPPYHQADSLTVGGVIIPQFDTKTYNIASPVNGSYPIWIADASWQVVSVTIRAETLSGTSGTCDVGAAASGTAATSETTFLTAAIDLTSATMTASTNYVPTLTATTANLNVGAGTSVVVKFAGTQNGTANVVISLKMQRI